MRSLRWPAIAVVFYWILRIAFDRASQDGGLITPSGGVSFGVAALGVLALGMRLVALFVVPAIVAYRVIAHALAGALPPRP